MTIPAPTPPAGGSAAAPASRRRPAAPTAARCRPRRRRPSGVPPVPPPPTGRRVADGDRRADAAVRARGPGYIIGAVVAALAIIGVAAFFLTRDGDDDVGQR